MARDIQSWTMHCNFMLLICARVLDSSRRSSNIAASPTACHSIGIDPCPLFWSSSYDYSFKMGHDASIEC